MVKMSGMLRLFSSFSLFISPMMILSICLVFLGPTMSLTSDNLYGVWLGLELNLFAFIIMMNPEGFWIAEPCIKYFVVQVIGSSFVLISAMTLNFFYASYSLFLSLIGFFIKAGIFPFHSWVPSVVNSSDWLVSGMVLTWQKLVPFIFVGFMSNYYILFVALVAMGILGGVGGLNQHSVRSMSAYSSFVHSSWMLASFMSSLITFLFYFLFYCVSLYIFFYGCCKVGKSYAKNKTVSFLGCLGILMLSGIPPMSGFFPKVVVFLSVDSLVVLWCVISSFISLKYYLSYFYLMLISSYNKDSFYNFSWFHFFFIVFFNLISFVYLLTII
uniref:NADH-ubiquinone oxidoreductase chain 2 n=1 Tax=Septifer bilocularis TaxID=102393 RepID=A0A516EZL8_9BIVA|nr:NADH dehydrogenase subunit 2 [Septifer bilocularis]QDO71945.1 NADH dehydrogenase subunit 2 [Septifer bilocularis]